jgi:hypothetical protein
MLPFAENKSVLIKVYNSRRNNNCHVVIFGFLWSLSPAQCDAIRSVRISPVTLGSITGALSTC